MLPSSIILLSLPRQSTYMTCETFSSIFVVIVVASLLFCSVLFVFQCDIREDLVGKGVVFEGG